MADHPPSNPTAPKSRSLRRWQKYLAKIRAARVLSLTGLKRRESLDPALIGLMASTHCRPCSCFICKNEGKTAKYRGYRTSQGKIELINEHLEND